MEFTVPTSVAETKKFLLTRVAFYDSIFLFRIPFSTLFGELVCVYIWEDRKTFSTRILHFFYYTIWSHGCWPPIKKDRSILWKTRIQNFKNGGKWKKIVKKFAWKRYLGEMNLCYVIVKVYRNGWGRGCSRKKDKKKRVNESSLEKMLRNEENWWNVEWKKRKRKTRIKCGTGGNQGKSWKSKSRMLFLEKEVLPTHS